MKTAGADDQKSHSGMESQERDRYRDMLAPVDFSTGKGARSRDVMEREGPSRGQDHSRGRGLVQW